MIIPCNQHELKILPSYFAALERGEKRFEVRKNDRDFCRGDFIIFREYDDLDQVYTGRVIAKWVGYILYGGRYGIDKDYVVFQLEDKQEDCFYD